MWRFLREHVYTVLFLAIWLVVANYAGMLLWGVLPIGVFLLRRIDHWPDILFGLIMCLVLSDSEGGIYGMAVMKSAKAAYVLTLLAILLLDQRNFQPMARVFTIFAPFLAYSFLPVLRSDMPLDALSKTASFSIIYLVVPNYVLRCFRIYKWDFLRALVWFLVLVLASQPFIQYFGSVPHLYKDDRFSGWFGNPNGMAIYVFLTWIIFALVRKFQSGLFSRWSVVFIYAVLTYYLITCGARTSLLSTIMFIMFIPFFRISTALGLISFVAAIGLGELISNQLPYIIDTFGLQEYMRVDTISDGSGRYIAWNYAWEQINLRGDFLFGAGFGHEYNVMLKGFQYLSDLGHQGGVHNGYLAMWMDTGIVGLILYFRSFSLIFIKAAKNTSIALAVMFSVMASNIYESWLAGSLNPYTTLLLIILTLMSEEEIIGAVGRSGVVEEEEAAEEEAPPPPQLVLPAR